MLYRTICVAAQYVVISVVKCEIYSFIHSWPDKALLGVPLD